jgi:hypothetical protein
VILSGGDPLLAADVEGRRLFGICGHSERLSQP